VHNTPALADCFFQALACRQVAVNEQDVFRIERFGQADQLSLVGMG